MSTTKLFTSNSVEIIGNILGVVGELIMRDFLKEIIKEVKRQLTNEQPSIENILEGKICDWFTANQNVEIGVEK
ncbi:hypothetical protein FOH38_01800 [Lysinibacillus fusiformis]|nr:hypothetical protein FOH38_01800 [Lysinibacillus fusiformis]